MEAESLSLIANEYPSYGSSRELEMAEYDFHCHSDEDERLNSNNKNANNKSAIRVLWLSVMFCLVFMVAEIIGGYIAQSLAIITDAAHLLTDFASMLVSLFALYISSRPASQRMSFGWHRAEVLGAFISVFMIWIITAFLVYMAIQRIITGAYEIDAKIMAITAAFGVLVNLIMAALLYFGGHTHSHGGGGRQHQESNHHHHHQSELELKFKGENSQQQPVNINVRAAMVHVIGDMLQSIGVLVAALLIYFNDSWSIADPICTLMFSVIVLFTTIYVVRDAVVILLEGRPSSINFRSVFDSLEQIDGVQKVHNLRIWCLSMDKIAISVHLEIRTGASAQQILRNTTMMLRDRYSVHESTVQIEGYHPSKQDCNQCIPPL